MDFGNKIKKFLTSPKTIISLIIITLIACVIGFLIPQITDKSPSYFALWKEKSPYTFMVVERLQLNRVYTSVWFLTLVFLITLSLGYSLYLQVKRNLRHSTEQRTKITEKDRDKIRAVFKKRQYHEHISLNSEQQLIFTKNSIGRWGGTIFHFGLFLVIISAILVLCFQNRGLVQLIEGDVFDGKENNFLVRDHGIFAGEFNTGFKTYLSMLTHDYWEKGELKFLESSIEIIKDSETIHKKLSINNPLLIGGTDIYQSHDYGYTLSFVLKKPSGEEILTHFNIDKSVNLQKPAFGTSDFPKTDYIFKMKFYPDVTNSSFYLTKSILYLTVLENSNIVFNGLIIPGNAIKIKDDILYFTGTRYWSGLIFVKNPGMLLAYIGFAIGIIGTAVIFLFPYKEIHVNLMLDTREFSISGTTKRYHAFFKEELNMIKSELKKVMANG